MAKKSAATDDTKVRCSEWTQYIITSLKEMSDKIAELNKFVIQMSTTCPEHWKQTAAVIEEVKELQKFKNNLEGQDPVGKVDDYIKTGTGWRLAIAGNVLAVIIIICGFIYSWGMMNEKITHMAKASESMQVTLSGHETAVNNVFEIVKYNQELIKGNKAAIATVEQKNDLSNGTGKRIVDALNRLEKFHAELSALEEQRRANP